MNKAFVREPDPDGRAYCPRCNSLGTPVGKAVLDHWLAPAARGRLGDSAWFCGFPTCEVAYFDQFDTLVTATELRAPVYPKDPSASLCACFGFTLDELDADVAEGTPTRIRALWKRSQGPDARCDSAAPDGQCCLREIQRIYMRQTSGGRSE